MKFLIALITGISSLVRSLCSKVHLCKPSFPIIISATYKLFIIKSDHATRFSYSKLFHTYEWQNPFFFSPGNFTLIITMLSFSAPIDYFSPSVCKKKEKKSFNQGFQLNRPLLAAQRWTCPRYYFSLQEKHLKPVTVFIRWPSLR